MPARLSMLALVVTMLALGGCGGSSHSSSSTPSESSEADQTASTAANKTRSTPVYRSKPGKALSNAELVGRANAICKSFNAQLAASESTAEKEATLARIAPAHAAIYKAGLVALSKLTPPASLESDWQQMLGATNALVGALTKLGEDAIARDSAAMHAVAAANIRVMAQMTAAARRAGLSECAQVG